jgi:CO/xanthine dehydrogenase FAD-binding subunit
MRPAAFSYEAPSSVEDALALLAQGEPSETRVLAGGQSLVPAMRLRHVQPKRIVDINRIKGLADVTERDDGVAFGALTRQQEVECSRRAKEATPLLVAALRRSGFAAVRARGTIGGAVAHGDPAGDVPAVLVALDGVVTAVSEELGARTIAARDLYRAPQTTTLAPAEVLTEVWLPRHDTHRSSFEKVSPGLGSTFAVVNAAVTLDVEDARVTRAAIGIGGVGATPMRATEAERRVIGEALGREVVDAAADAATEECRPVADGHGSMDYRRHLVGIVVQRALTRAGEAA